MYEELVEDTKPTRNCCSYQQFEIVCEFFVLRRNFIYEMQVFDVTSFHLVVRIVMGLFKIWSQLNCHPQTHGLDLHLLRLELER